MGWKKKLLIGSVSVIFVFVVLGVLFGGSETESSKTTGQVTGATTQNLIDKSASEMLPTRSDIQTEFFIDPIEDITKDAPKGVESAATLSSHKIEDGFGSVVVEYTIYKFTKQEDASTWYQTETNNIVQRGGYSVIKLTGNCFGYNQDFGFQAQRGQGLCVDRNVVYIVDFASSNSFESPDRAIKDGITLLDKKVE